LKIDLHVHSCYSRDALSKPETIVRRAKKRGLSGIAITDHNSVASWGRLLPIAKREKLLVVRGEELKIREAGMAIGELSALFLQQEIKAVELDEVIDDAREQDALLVIQHPFDLFRKRWKKMRYWKRFHAIEAFNSRCVFNSWNKKAMRFAREHQFPVTAGSDAHTPWEIGNAFVECNAQSEEEIREAILKKDVRVAGRLSSPFIHAFSTVAGLKLLKPM
jgi:hypothetical protein